MGPKKVKRARGAFGPPEPYEWETAAGAGGSWDIRVRPDDHDHSDAEMTEEERLKRLSKEECGAQLLEYLVGLKHAGKKTAKEQRKTAQNSKNQ